MVIAGVPGCCGIREICGLRLYRKSIAALRAFQAYSDGNFRYAIFSQAGSRATYGVRFAALIQKNNLGEVLETGTHVNPNSGNPLKVWIWTVDHNALQKWNN